MAKAAVQVRAPRVAQSREIPRGPAIEHRWSRRVATDIEVPVIVRDRSLVQGRIRNVGRHGVFLETEAGVAVGACLRLCLRPHAVEEAVEIPALVIHRSRAGMGLMLNLRHPLAAHTLATLTDETYGTRTGRTEPRDWPMTG